MSAASFRKGIATALALVGAGAACSRGDAEVDLSPDVEPPPATVPDAGAPPVADAGGRDVPLVPELPECSTDGWCYTPFPDKDLVFRDIWPLEDRAFAVVESTSRGIKFLEWTSASNAWSYIDDLSQNDHGAGTFASDVYAPNGDEVFVGVGPSFVFHGRRSGGTWSWTSQRLADNHPGHDGLSDDHAAPVMSPFGVRVKPMLRVWGTGQDEIYAAYSNTVFRRSTSNGAFEPMVTFDDLAVPNEHVFIAELAGTGADDLWIAGARVLQGPCPLVVHKTASGLEHVVDADYDPTSRGCVARDGSQTFDDTALGWALGVATVAAEDVIVNFNGKGVVRVQKSASDYTFTSTEPSIVTSADAMSSFIRSVWYGDGDTWLSSWGTVFRRAGGTDDFVLSRISRDVSPVFSPIYRVRGTSKTNLWAIGDQHALHKTTP